MVKEYGDINLRDRNTFGIDVCCDRFVEFSDADDLRSIFTGESVTMERWMVLSGGSNVVFTGDYKGTILHPVNKEIEITDDDGNKVHVKVGAGAEWYDFVGWCVDRGLWGAENLSDIPGYAGSSPVQNIGAYGVEVKDIIESVEVFAVDTGKTATIARDHCGFGYRDSVFKRELKGKAVITAVNYVLSRTPNPCLGYGDLFEKVNALGGPSLRNVRRAVMEIRSSKLPDPIQTGNAGSFFKNPLVPETFALELKGEYPDMPIYPGGKEGLSKLAAGWLIDRCGWRGHRRDRVGVHERQALVLVNLGGATGKDVVDLAADIQADVFKKFGVGIETEVNVV